MGKQLDVDFYSDFADLIEEFEGFQPNVYLDIVNVPTIGYGFTSKDVLKKYAHGMTRDEAKEVLKTEAQTYINRVQHWNAKANLQLDAQQFAALSSFAFNVGNGNLDALLQKRVHEANPKARSYNIAHGILLYNRAGGKVSHGLTLRRHREAILFLSRYPDLQQELNDKLDAYVAEYKALKAIKRKQSRASG